MEVIQDTTTDEDIGHGSSADSGYSSHGSLTTLSPNLSSQRSSVASLQPIYENVEFQLSVSTPEVTPTTRNMQRISAFHITTPNSLKRSAPVLCTPTKTLTPKKRRLIAKERSKAYRDIIENIHVDDENSENYDMNVVELSPIKLSGNVLQERNANFNRKASFSSTPINEEVVTKSKSVSKTNFFNTRVLRKTQSFSPSKTIAVKHTEAGITLKKSGQSIPRRTFQETPNPARKLIDFSPGRFQALLNGCSGPSTVASSCIESSASVNTDELTEIPAKVRKLVRQNATESQNAAESQNDLAKSLTPVNSKLIDNDQSTSQKIKPEDCFSVSDTKNNLSITTTPDSKIRIKTSPQQKSLSPLRQKSLLPLKSVKKIRRNLSFNFNESPKKEVDKIVFPEIPHSPPKQHIPSNNRRTSVTIHSPNAKRSLFDLSQLLPKRKSVAHHKYFDILGNLVESNPAIKEILSYLCPKDFHAIYNVCHKWRSIIESDANTNNQRKNYLLDLYKDKENLLRKKPIKTISLSDSKYPLKRLNSINSRKPSLVIDPSHSLDDPYLIFNEMKNQRRVKCPLCRHPSIVSKQTINQRDTQMRNPLTRKATFDFELGSDSSQLQENLHEFAVCTRRSCGFKFCVHCLCAYHDGDCPIQSWSPTLPWSPNEPTDLKLLYPTGSQSKRNLRRLCSLHKS